MAGLTGKGTALPRPFQPAGNTLGLRVEVQDFYTKGVIWGVRHHSQHVRALRTRGRLTVLSGLAARDMSKRRMLMQCRTLTSVS